MAVETLDANIFDQTVLIFLRYTCMDVKSNK